MGTPRRKKSLNGSHRLCQTTAADSDAENAFRNSLRETRYMARPDRDCSNALFNELADWNHQLSHLSDIEERISAPANEEVQP